MPGVIEKGDVVVVGGGFAGMSAALQLGRARRRVVVVDAGAPRNRSASAAHGFLGWDGIAPLSILEQAREELSRYSTVVLQRGVVERAERAEDDAFELELRDGQRLRSKRLILAEGVRDILPDVPGLAERWGTSVFHCPYCHGYEVADRRLGVVGDGPNALHLARLLLDWSASVTLFTHGGPGPEDPDRSLLETLGVVLETRAVQGVVGEGNGISGLRIEDGGLVPLDAVFAVSRTEPFSGLASGLGCGIEEGVTGSFVRTTERKETSVPGVFAAGDVARPMHSVALAVADGAIAGIAAHQSLVFGGPP